MIHLHHHNLDKMENQKIKINQKNNGKKIIGGAILLVGIVLLAKQFGMWFPSWLISWPVLLIVIGLANGLKYQFRNSSWLIITGIGILFLLEKINSDLSFAKFWPVILIAVGLWFLFGRKNVKNPFDKNPKFQNFDSYNQNETSYSQTQQNNDSLNNENQFQNSNDEYIDSVAIFGGAKRSVFSKNFKGGEITSIFGGSEINFSHADINGEVVLETAQIFGGTKIIVPPTWNVISEMTPIFGGVDDKRSSAHVLTDRSKVLIIKGTTVFGGFEIRNF